MKELVQKCECGKIIKGTSESQMKFNLALHRRSKGHKKSMALDRKLKIGGDS